MLALGIIFSILLAIAAIGCGIGALVERARRREMANDPGRVIFEKTVELLLSRPCEWKRELIGTWDRRYTLAGITVCVNTFWEWTYSVEVACKSVKPGPAWHNRIAEAHREMVAAHEKADQLNSICDAIEALAKDNVIPLRRVQ